MAFKWHWGLWAENHESNSVLSHSLGLVLVEVISECRRMFYPWEKDLIKSCDSLILKVSFRVSDSMDFFAQEKSTKEESNNCFRVSPY
jgi:hypothetical protein